MDTHPKISFLTGSELVWYNVYMVETGSAWDEVTEALVQFLDDINGDSPEGDGDSPEEWDEEGDEDDS